MKNKYIGFIGAGNMATAIIEGMLSGGHPAGEIAVFDIDVNKTDIFSKKGIKVYESANDLSENSEIIFLCVKPQNYEELLNEISLTAKTNKIYVTIAAGISTSYIQNMLKSEVKVIRVMPNTPLLVKEGASALCKTSNVSDSEFKYISDIFGNIGTVQELPESLMNAVISVNSSSPAYIYLFAKGIIDGAKEQGIDEETAKSLFCKTLIGSAKMIMESGKTPDELIKMVSSPGGTTLKALEVFNDNDLIGTIKKAMLACTKRAEELGR